MTREEFIKVLDKRRYSYKIEGDKLVVTHEDDVFLGSLTSLPPGVEFKNRGGVDLRSLQTLPPDVEFKNEGSVNLKSLIGGDGYFVEWEGNIEGIDSKRLLNMMIKQGLFER